MGGTTGTGTAREHPTLREVAGLASGIFGFDANLFGKDVLVEKWDGRRFTPIAHILPRYHLMILANPDFAERALQFKGAYEQKYMPYSEGEFQIFERNSEFEGDMISATFCR